MGFLKHLWGFLFIVAMILIVGGVVWYLLFYGGPGGYNGGKLVGVSGMGKGVGGDEEKTVYEIEPDLRTSLLPT